MDGSWYLPPQRLGDRLQDPAAAAPELAAASRRVLEKCVMRDKELPGISSGLRMVAMAAGIRNAGRDCGQARGEGDWPPGGFGALQYKPFCRFRVDGAEAGRCSKPLSLADLRAFLKAVEVNGC
jgi:hypothetical protein